MLEVLVTALYVTKGRGISHTNKSVGISIWRFRQEKKESIDSWVDDIEKLDIRWLVRDTLVEIKNLRNENNLLKSEICLNIDLRNQETAMNPLGNLEALSDSELRALEHSISEKHYEDMLWTKDHRGKVTDNEGNQVFKTGFVSAIEKILKTK